MEVLARERSYDTDFFLPETSPNFQYTKIILIGKMDTK